MSKEIKRIAILTSGGDAPGMNAAIRAIVRTATHEDLHSYGIESGYKGMIEGNLMRLESKDVANTILRGGTILKTARCEEFKSPEGRKQAYESLLAYDIDAVIAIGGNGTYTGAYYFTREYDIPFIGLPGTIDNDIFGTDFTIGYDTAINTAVEAIDKIRDTASSHNRLFFVEVMGRHAGFIALETGIASGAAATFLPETNWGIDELMVLLKKASIRKKLFNIVVVAEGNKSGTAAELAQHVKENFPGFDSRVATIGHLQRGGAPSAYDRVLASRLGYEAVIALQNGIYNKALGLVNGKVHFVEFQDAINKKKELDNEKIKMLDVLAM
ncbi:MAG: 6-phosphofructokinase [Deltaproteobacteria bacterium]